MAHPDLEAEQAHIDRAYGRLEAMRATAREMLESALRQGRGGTPQAREEREVLVGSSLQRLGRLDIGDQSLCFGRIDHAPAGPDDSASGEAFYVGRLGVYGEDQEPLVVDWRAPVAEPFYRATGRDPMGLSRRRHFATEGRKLLDIEDELFALRRTRTGREPGKEGSPSASGDDEDAHEDEWAAAGKSSLLAALERSRSGHMRDIVATVQREQDEVIRADLPGVLLVQGGPGTGKTAVALHRAAYLLYTYRFPLERQGVLVVGPSQVFLRYIERVLPSLGESGVTLTTIEGLVPGARARAAEDDSLAALKGEARMSELVAKAVRDRERPLNKTVEIPYGSVVLRLTRAESRAAVSAARRRHGAHNAKRRYVEATVSRMLRSKYLSAVAARAGAPGSAAGDVEPEDLDSADFARDIRRVPAVADALDRMWPRLYPEELLHDLYGSLPLIASAGRGLLSEEEVASLHRPRSDAIDRIPWTAADLPLLDEARVLLGPVRASAPDDGPRSYGHIVVDEAQDLSPMQLRMLSRRCLSGSMTVVGDIAQATGPRAPDGWEQVIEHLPSARPARITELTVNYRTPAEVMQVAGRVLEVAAPGLGLPRSVRSTGERPAVVEVAEGLLAGEVTRRARCELARVGEGTVAVICAGASRAGLAAAMSSAGLPVSEALEEGIGAGVTLVPIRLAKGLEFDSVVVAEPALVTREEGLRALFVALSRPTRRLTVVHSMPLPVQLTA